MQNISIMELRHLRYFVTVAREMHFRRAAEKLNMTQPPLSQQIQQLEAELGFNLFIRRGRSIVLTDAGQVFLEEVEAILAAVDKAVHRAQRVSEGKTGQLRIGFVESAIHHHLPEIITRYRASYPDVDITLNRLTSNEQLAALSDRKIDIGFCRVQQTDIQVPLIAETIVLEPIIALIPENHLLATATNQVKLEDFASEKIILFPKNLGTSLYTSIENACLNAGFILKVTQEATQFTTIVGLVAAGMGISILPHSVKAFQHPAVRYIELSEIEPVPIAIVWHQEAQSATFANFLTEVQNFFAG